VRRLDTREPGFDRSLDELLQSRTAGPTDPSIAQQVHAIIDAIRKGGDTALVRLAQQYDGLQPGTGADDLEIPSEEIQRALEATPDETIEALQTAADRIEMFHQHQRESDWAIESDDGTLLAHRVVPLKTVGIYVPGGTAAYPSSVLMNAIPARVAGVENVIMVTPAPSGRIEPAVLAAAKIAGVDRIFRVGGAQAIAALALGTTTIPKVDRIVGPGNIWVATAKQQLFGVVNIDMIAGPSEICIIATADGGATAEQLAADLLSQAEHDIHAMVCLISPDSALIDRIEEALWSQLKRLPREPIARAAIDSTGVAILARDLNDAVTVAEHIAPEHLELVIPNADEVSTQIRNAGAIFCGPHTPEAVGDYIAGPNHVLPTSGSARFFSPLGVYDFVKRINVIRFSRSMLETLGPKTMLLAQTEGLAGHAESIRLRLEESEKPGNPGSES